MKVSIFKSLIKDKRNLTFISFILLIVFWKLLSLIINSGLIIPSPESTFKAIFQLIRTGEFYIIILYSLKRGLIGFAFSFILGITIGFLAGLNDIINRLLEPVLVIVRSTPLMSVILLALIWFKTENVPIFASFLVSFPIITSNTIEGIKNIDPKIMQMAKIYKIRKWRIVGEIYFPAILPFTIAAISTSAGIGWKAVIAAEVLSQPEYAIGTSLQDSRIYLNTDRIFAWTIVAILISYVFEKIIRLSEKFTITWKKDNEFKNRKSK